MSGAAALTFKQNYNFLVGDVSLSLEAPLPPSLMRRHYSKQDAKRLQESGILVKSDTSRAVRFVESTTPSDAALSHTNQQARANHRVYLCTRSHVFVAFKCKQYSTVQEANEAWIKMRAGSPMDLVPAMQSALLFPPFRGALPTILEKMVVEYKLRQLFTRVLFVS